MYNTCMDHTNLTYRDVESLTSEILRQMNQDSWRPDYVVGLTRGGLLPAVLMSQYLDVPMDALKVSLRDNHETCSNLSMAEDAYNGKKILIVDDINDTGATLNWIKQDWEDFHPSKPKPWKKIWGDSVRVAVLIDNLPSKSKLDINYCGMEIDKEADPRWVNFPFENWWKK
jgi:uncharacterized protein